MTMADRVPMITISVGASETVLAKTFDQLEEVQFEMEHAITMPSDQDWPCHWITGPSREEIERALRDDPDVSGFEHIRSENDRFLYHLATPDGTVGFRDIIPEKNGKIITAIGKEGEWKLQVRCRNTDDLTRIHDRLKERGTSPTVHQIHSTDAESEEATLLTEQQR